jgi:hypothetical protein
VAFWWRPEGSAPRLYLRRFHVLGLRAVVRQDRAVAATGISARGQPGTGRASGGIEYGCQSCITTRRYAQPGMQQLRVLGVVEVTADSRRIAYLNEPVEITDELLRSSSPAEPTEVFRFAAACEEQKCAHSSTGHVAG